MGLPRHTQYRMDKDRSSRNKRRDPNRSRSRTESPSRKNARLRRQPRESRKRERSNDDQRSERSSSRFTRKRRHSRVDRQSTSDRVRDILRSEKQPRVRDSRRRERSRSDRSSSGRSRVSRRRVHSPPRSERYTPPIEPPDRSGSSRESRRNQSPGEPHTRYCQPNLSSQDMRASLRRSPQPCSAATPTIPDLTSAVSSASEHKDRDANMLNTFKELVHAMRPDRVSENFPNINVLPEFDPSRRTQTIDMWIGKVNECAQIYGWSERQIIHYSLPKLVGLAQKWYQGLPSLLFTWVEWQSKLRLAFPSDENYGILLTEMLGCRARFGDQLEEYFYEKMVLLNRCNISGKNAIDCILLGIEDRSVRMSAEAAQFTEPDKLLVYLRNIKITRRPEKSNAPLQSSASDNKKNRPFKNIQNQGSVRPRTSCYNCGEEGHPYFKCSKPIKRCEKCRKVGHLDTECTIVTESVNKVLRISGCINNDAKYFKPALVNGKKLDCFIDFGSQCTMLGESVARSITDTWSLIDLPVLRGFGDSIVNCLGKFECEIEVDSVKATVQVLVVPDHLLQVPLLIGQTYTEQDHVVVHKTKSELKILTSLTVDSDVVNLFISESAIVDGYTKVSVFSDPNISGDVFVGLSVCQSPYQEFEIMQSVITLENGKGFLIIKGLRGPFDLKSGTIISRATLLKESSLLDVNKIQSSSQIESVVSLIDKKMVPSNENITQSESDALIKLLNEFRDCFAFSVNELGCANDTEMEIKLHDTTPVVYRPYRLSYSEREVVRNIVKELEEAGIVRPSSSNYASPIILVKKKTGDYRLCIDFRALNKKTVKEHYPLPRIDDQLDSLSGFKYYTSLDLASGYYQIKMSDTSKHLTAFVTPDGHYEFDRMPFGLVNAPSTFQKTINNILGNARFKEAFAYMDDVIIPSKTVEDGLTKLREVFILFQNAGLTLKLAKCRFFMQTIDYLGFEVNEDGIRPGKNKIEAVEKFPRPVDQHTVRQFIGLASFFRRFVRGFSVIARPLTSLLKKDTKWQWGSLEEEAFMKLKAELVKRPILAFYNPKYETQVHTDASKLGIAGILLQRPNKDSPLAAVAYYSRQTSPEESRFTSYDLETLAVVMSLQQFRVYLLGIPFSIVTDCNSLRATFEKRDMLPRVARWWGIMQEYDFNIIYKPGTAMAHVDALSRNPITDHSNVEVRCINSDWISTVQQNDDELQNIITTLKNEESDKIVELKNNYCVKRGLLYRKTDDGDRWVVPKGVRWQILKANHDDIGHFALDKTYEKIKSQYWFAKMNKFIKKYVESCLECAHSKAPSGMKSGKLHPIDKTSIPFHTIHIDHLGPFIRSKKKNTHLLVIIDGFTKFIILAPVKSTKSSHSIKVMKKYFHTFGVPTRLISDRGSSFTSKLFREYIHSLGIKHILNAVATPRANGQVERYNRTILAALTTKNHLKPENRWDECVSEVQWGLNNTLNKGTGKTPAEALFGIRPVGTQDALLRLSVNDDLQTSTGDHESIRNEMTDHIAQNQLLQKERFDKNRKEKHYKVGELVRIEREIPSTGQSRKLVPKLRGPYRVVKVLDNDRYVVEDTSLTRRGNKTFSGVFPVDKIYPWLVFNRSNNSETEISSDEGEE